MKKEMRVFEGKVYGVKVSDYALEKGYLDYFTLSEVIGDCILNNTIYEETFEDWEIVTGEFENEYGELHDIYQYYIISRYGYVFLQKYTDEIVFYNEKLDVYVWGVTHFGTSWDYVLTDIKLVD
jgi:hypothetical protein